MSNLIQNPVETASHSDDGSYDEVRAIIREATPRIAKRLSNENIDMSVKLETVDGKTNHLKMSTEYFLVPVSFEVTITPEAMRAVLLYKNGAEVVADQLASDFVGAMKNVFIMLKRGRQ